jgi:hypothetical protein
LPIHWTYGDGSRIVGQFVDSSVSTQNNFADQNMLIAQNTFGSFGAEVELEKV